MRKQPKGTGDNSKQGNEPNREFLQENKLNLSAEKNGLLKLKGSYNRNRTSTAKLEKIVKNGGRRQILRYSAARETISTNHDKIVKY